MIGVWNRSAAVIAASVLAAAAHAQTPPEAASVTEAAQVTTAPTLSSGVANVMREADFGLDRTAFDSLAPGAETLPGDMGDAGDALLSEPLSTFDPAAPFDMRDLLALDGPVQPTLDLEDRFTLRGFGFDTIGSFDDIDMVEFNAGAKWGFTLGLDSRGSDFSGFDGMRAGAFLNITPRMRLGGSFGVGETTTEAAGLDVWRDSREQELKIESAFRF